MHNLFNLLQDRGLIAQCSHLLEIKNLIQTNNQFNFYLGIDPTAKSLHIGHLLGIKLAKTLLKNSPHKLYIILGQGTALIGDPSGKTTERKILTTDQTKINLDCLKNQIKHLLSDLSEDKYKILNNYDWIKKLSYLEFLQDIGKQFSVNQMLSAKCFQNRLERGLSFLEFNYMLLQGYDFYYLCKHYNVTVQIGGDDQWSNMLAGIDLNRKILKKQTFCLTFPLLVDSYGNKMGKSSNQGTIWLNKDLTSAFDFFQFWQNVDDTMIIEYLKLLTFIDLEKINKSKNQLARSSEHENIYKSLKRTLAYEITSWVHGKDQANICLNTAKELFDKKALNQTTNKQTSKNIDINLLSPIKLDVKLLNQTKQTAESIEYIKILDVFIHAKITDSKKQARRLIEQGGVEIGGTLCKDVNQTFKLKDLQKPGIIIKKGKKSYYRVQVSNSII